MCITQQWQHICAISVPVGGAGRIRRRLLACAMKCCTSHRIALRRCGHPVRVQNTVNSTTSAALRATRQRYGTTVSQSDVLLLHHATVTAPDDLRLAAGGLIYSHHRNFKDCYVQRVNIISFFFDFFPTFLLSVVKLIRSRKKDACIACLLASDAQPHNRL